MVVEWCLTDRCCLKIRYRYPIPWSIIIFPLIYAIAIRWTLKLGQLFIFSCGKMTLCEIGVDKHHFPLYKFAVNPFWDTPQYDNVILSPHLVLWLVIYIYPTTSHDITVKRLIIILLYSYFSIFQQQCPRWWWTYAMWKMNTKKGQLSMKVDDSWGSHEFHPEVHPAIHPSLNHPFLGEKCRGQASKHATVFATLRAAPGCGAESLGLLMGYTVYIYRYILCIYFVYIYG